MTPIQREVADAVAATIEDFVGLGLSELDAVHLLCAATMRRAVDFGLRTPEEARAQLERWGFTGQDAYEVIPEP